MLAETPQYERQERSRAGSLLFISGVAVAGVALYAYLAGKSGLDLYLTSSMYILGYSDRLVVRFGRFGPFKRTVRYSDIRAVEVIEMPLVLRWQVGLKRVGGGWLFNPGTRDAIRIEYSPGPALIVGTTDPHRLKEFLDTKVASSTSFS